MHFNELGINPLIINALTALGFTEPTEIQQKAIPLLLAGTKDLIGLPKPVLVKQLLLVFPSCT